MSVVKKSIFYCRGKLAEAIYLNQIRFFADRVMAGWLDADFRSLDDLATSVGLEVLGINDTLIDFPKTELVDSLKTVLALTELKMGEQFTRLLKKVDSELKEAMSSLPVPAQSVRTIVSDMNALVELAKATKGALTGQLYPLQERLSAEGVQLDRMQSLNSARFINGLYFVEGFVSQYAATFNKTMGGY